MRQSVRPTKKQHELLNFIEAFIAEHGYSPSYREIMNGLQYNSVATVALHIGNLIKRGHLQKREHSARSLEVVRNPESAPIELSEDDGQHERWLMQKVEEYLAKYDKQTTSEADQTDRELLGRALSLLGFDTPASRLTLQPEPVKAD
jgi:SOS-response transcriptional repressor LexA